MIRAAAKNHRDVVVVVDPHDYGRVVQEIRTNDGGVSAATCYRLAVKTFEHTAGYDGPIANYLGAIADDGAKQPFPNTVTLQYQLAQRMRYGENPHQQGAFYVERNAPAGSLALAESLGAGGKEQSGEQQESYFHGNVLTG